MRKTITALLATAAAFLFAGNVYAAALTAKIEAPKSPTNLTDLNINVVVLDQDQVPSISVQCYYQKNGGGFSALGSAITVIPGGNNTANCQTNSSIITGEGTYDFYATATDGTNSTTTSTVSVSYNTSGPGNPTNYSKSRVSTCDYKITFRTADDAGKTVKVEVYRSADTSFTADAGTRVDSINIGSNTDGSSTTTPPNCTTDYHFAIRAFDSIGNGSGLVGDSISVTTTTTTTTGASGAAGAIPAGTNGNVLGTSNGASEGATGASGAVLGESSPSGTPTPETVTYTPPKASLFSRNAVLAVGAVAVILVGIWLAKRKKSE